jgi:hypothetical protein
MKRRMTVMAGLAAAVAAAACSGPSVERVRSENLEEAYQAFRTNIAAIQRGDTEAYLAHYLDSPELVIANADSVRRGFMLFAEARRADEEWPDTLIAGRPTMVWISPGVVWGTYPYTVVQRGDTTRGWSERIFVKTGGGWKIVVTGSSARCDC